MSKKFYPNLVETMKKEHVTKTDIATVLGIHFNTVTDKLEGRTTSESKTYNIGFTIVEAVVIKNTLFEKYDFNWLFNCSLISNYTT